MILSASSGPLIELTTTELLRRRAEGKMREGDLERERESESVLGRVSELGV